MSTAVHSPLDTCRRNHAYDRLFEAINLAIQESNDSDTKELCGFINRLCYARKDFTLEESLIDDLMEGAWAGIQGGKDHYPLQWAVMEWVNVIRAGTINEYRLRFFKRGIEKLPHSKFAEYWMIDLMSICVHKLKAWFAQVKEKA